MRRQFMKMIAAEVPYVTPDDMLRTLRCRESGWIPWYAYLNMPRQIYVATSL